MYIGTCGCPWAWAKAPASSGPVGLRLKVPPKLDSPRRGGALSRRASTGPAVAQNTFEWPSPVTR